MIKLICFALLCIHSGMLYAQGNGNSPSVSDPAVILLDFDGHEVRATPWNWNGTFYAEPTSFNDRQVREIIERVEADFDIFDVRITFEEKEYQKANPVKRMRIIITPTSQWYGVAGGVALIGSFSWGDDTPCFVFSDQLNFNVKFIAEAISHELGHTLGLQHQSEYDEYCNKVQEYNQGMGDSSGWAPIMGTGYFKSITTWSIGQSTEDCTVIQDDLSIIKQVLQYRPESAPDDSTAIMPLPIRGYQIKTSGYIRNQSEQDRYSFRIDRPTRINLFITPGTGDRECIEPNLNVQVRLYNAHQQEILKKDLPGLLSVSLDTTLTPGGYYILVEGAATNYLPDYGSVGAYSINGFISVTLPVRNLELKGITNGHAHTLNWKYESDEKVNTMNVYQSADGSNFTLLRSAQPEKGTVTVVPANGTRSYYRIEAITNSGSVYASNIISLQHQSSNDKYFAYISGNEIIIYTEENCRSELYLANGSRLNERPLVKGFNRIPMASSWKGMLVLRISTSRQPYTFRLIKW